jgi:glycosyltransferase involved in cell wall biosynthesis
MHVPAIVKTEHNDHAHFKPYQNAANAVTLTLADCVICNSDHTQASYHPWEKPLADRKSVTIYNGVNMRRIAEGRQKASRVRSEVDAPADAFLVGSVGRLVRQKNYKRLIQSLSLVDSQDAEVRLIIAGGGPLRSAIEREIEKRGLDGRVTLLGNVERERVYQLLHAIDAFVMPSRWEGFCNAAVEAMAAGCPIIASDIETLREVVGPVGAYADPHSPDDMAAVIERMAAMSAEKRQRLGQVARQRAEEKFSVQRTAQKYIDTYFRLLEEKQPGSFFRKPRP